MQEGMIIDIVYNTLSDGVYIVYKRMNWKELYFGTRESISDWLNRKDWKAGQGYIFCKHQWLTFEEMESSNG